MSSHTSSSKKPVSVEVTLGGKTLSIETGKLAKQAAGAVVVRLGDTMTLVATVSAPGREGLDFFPLTVDYREKVYAAGKFPGGFIKREGRPSTKEILTSRLIDRPIRPLFPPQFRHEVQIQAGPISADRQNDPDVLSITGASASLILCDNLPFLGPIGAVRLGRVDGQLVPFPTAEEMAKSDLDLIVASTDKAIVMIEGFGQEVPDAEMGDAIMAAHKMNQELIDLQHRLRGAAGLPPPRPSRGGPRSADPVDAREVLLRPARGQEDLRQGRAERGRQGAGEARPRRDQPRRYRGRAHARPGQVGVPRPPGTGRPRDDPRRIPPRRSRCEGPPSDLVRGRPAAQGPRLGPLPEGRDAGPGHDRARHLGRRAEGRRDHGGVLQAILPRLQHAELRRRRGSPDPRTRPSRDRTRHACRTFARADPAAQGRVPVHDPRRVGHPGIQRVLLDGLRLRRHALDDGRRGADLRPGGRHLDRPGPR